MAEEILRLSQGDNVSIPTPESIHQLEKMNTHGSVWCVNCFSSITSLIVQTSLHLPNVC